MQKLDDLVVFIRVVERGSFIAAARQLGMPAATVSRKVQDLEARLGIELLRRTTRRVFVTEAGQEVYDRASRGLALIDEAELIARRLHETPGGTLRVLAPYSLGLMTLNPALPAFQRLYPDVRISLTLDNYPLDLVEHGFDVALRIGALKDSTYMARRLYRGRRRLFAAPGFLAAQAPVESFADLENLTFVSVVGNQPEHSIVFTNGSERQTIELKPMISCNEGSAVLGHVLGGFGFSILSEILCQTALDAGTLAPILPDWYLAEELEVSIIFGRHAATDPKIRLFVDFLLRHALRAVPGSPLPSVA
jgi:DNA-binding transcriptional LysR family regulator